MTCRSQTNQMFFFTAAHQHLSYAARTNMKKIAAWIFVFIPHVQRDRYEHVCCYHWATQEKEKKNSKIPCLCCEFLQGSQCSWSDWCCTGRSAAQKEDRLFFRCSLTPELYEVGTVGLVAYTHSLALWV